MDLNYIFLLFVINCKKLLSKTFTKLLFCLITLQIILLITSKKDYTDKKKQTSYKKYKTATDTSPSLVNYNFLTTNNSNNNFQVPLRITSTIKHLKNSTHFKEKDLPIDTLNLDFYKSPKNTLLPHKTPILLSNFFIVESFTGDIFFNKDILNIKNIKNKLIFKSNTLIINSDDRKDGVLFLSGYLETDVTYFVPEKLKLPIISSTHNHIIRTPFNSSLHVKFNNDILGDKPYFTNLNLTLKDSKYFVDFKLKNEYKLDNDISLFKVARLSIIANYALELYDIFIND